MKSCVWLIAGGLALTSCEGASGPEVPRVPEGKLPDVERYDLPVILTDKEPGAMEAITAGTLVRRGPCLHLGTGPEEAVVLWEEGTTIELVDEQSFAIVLPSGLRVLEGDTLRGGGGSLPPLRPISDFANEPVPEECATGGAVQFHSVEIVKTAGDDDADIGLPPPPPPAPSFLDSVKMNNSDGGAIKGVIHGVEGPREALFIHLLSEIREARGQEHLPVCLRQVDDKLFTRLSQRFDKLYRVGECRWSDGGVVLRRDETKAVFMSARLDCDGDERCVAEGARVYGNVGGEGQGYVLRPVAGGWEIKTVGLSWIS